MPLYPPQPTPTPSTRYRPNARSLPGRPSVLGHDSPCPRGTMQACMAHGWYGGGWVGWVPRLPSRAWTPAGPRRHEQRSACAHLRSQSFQLSAALDWRGARALASPASAPPDHAPGSQPRPERVVTCCLPFMKLRAAQVTPKAARRLVIARRRPIIPLAAAWMRSTAAVDIAAVWLPRWRARAPRQALISSVLSGPLTKSRRGVHFFGVIMSGDDAKPELRESSAGASAWQAALASRARSEISARSGDSVLSQLDHPTAGFPSSGRRKTSSHNDGISAGGDVSTNEGGSRGRHVAGDFKGMHCRR